MQSTQTATATTCQHFEYSMCKFTRFFFHISHFNMLTMGSPNQWDGDEGAGGSKSVLAWESEYAEESEYASDELADLSASCHKSSPTVRKAVSRERGGSPTWRKDHGVARGVSPHVCNGLPQSLYLLAHMAIEQEIAETKKQCRNTETGNLLTRTNLCGIRVRE